MYSLTGVGIYIRYALVASTFDWGWEPPKNCNVSVLQNSGVAGTYIYIHIYNIHTYIYIHNMHVPIVHWGFRIPGFDPFATNML